MGTKWTGAWAGGRTYQDRRGRTVYVLERQIDGTRYGPSLGPISIDSAMAELALFERDPTAYKARREAARGFVPGAVEITTDRVEGWLAKLEKDGCDKGYRRDSHRYILEWREDLGSADLRSVKLKAMHDALDKRKNSRLHRVAALKSFTAYLRDRGELEADSSLLLHAPTPKPEKSLRQKGYSADTIKRLYRGLDDQAVRDVICVRAFTGLHHSELKRLVEGKGYILDVQGHGEIAGTITLPHKSGDPHVQSVTAQVLAALRRIERRGVCPDGRWIARTCQAACDALKLEVKFNPGELRHTYITLCATGGRKVKPGKGGIPIGEVSAAVGHRNPRTTKKFYDGTLVPPMMVPPLVLTHPRDPAKLEQGVAHVTSP